MSTVKRRIHIEGQGDFQVTIEDYEGGGKYVAGIMVPPEPKPYPFIPGTNWIDKYGDVWEVGGSCEMYRPYWNKGYSGMPVKDVQNILGPLTQVVTPAVSYGAAQVIAPPEPKRWKDRMGQEWVEDLYNRDLLHVPYSASTYTREAVERRWGKLREYARRDSLKPGDMAISSHYGQCAVKSATQYGTDGQTTEIHWEGGPYQGRVWNERYPSDTRIEVISRATEGF